MQNFDDFETKVQPEEFFEEPIFSEDDDEDFDEWIPDEGIEHMEDWDLDEDTWDF